MVPIVGAEDKKPILDDRPSDRNSWLILLKQAALSILSKCGIGIVNKCRASPLAAHIVLIAGSVPSIGAGFRHDSQMVAQVGAVLCVGVRLNADFVNHI